MRFSEAWLREYVNPRISTAELAEQLTMAGLEVDAVEPAAPAFSGVVVAKVVEVERHPNADKLQVCRVSTGTGDPLQIVCGAPNVRIGMKAPLAGVGAILPDSLKIKKSKLRGVESFGMLCSAKELGLAETSEGLWELPADAPVGEDIRSYLQLDDNLIEIDLTPNRADCLSVEGIAREVAVLNRIDWQPQASEPLPPGCDDRISLHVEEGAKAACPRYLGRIVRGIDPAAATPLWMQERLRRSGIRSLGAVVDITNYVLLELGQPLHAFDAGCIEGGIWVRMSRSGERMTLLNGQEIELSGDELVIADASVPLALAGIMGGEDSAVTENTRDIFLECAFFSPESIMGRARRYGLHTDSSHRFERGVDPDLQQRALERTTRLILEIAGGVAGPMVEEVCSAHLPRRVPIHLRASRVQALLGKPFPAGEITDILERLGLQVRPMEDGEWRVFPPSFRFDLSLEADLVEELARIAGYQHLPVHVPTLPMHLHRVPEDRIPLARVQDLLCDRGYREAITYSFVDQVLQQKLAPGLEPVSLANPLSAEMAVMRTTLWTGLLTALQHNLKRQRVRGRLFEVGLRFYLEGEDIRQEKQLAVVAAGPALPEQWGESAARPVDFYDLKGDAEALLDLTGRRRDFRFCAARHPALHPGQSASIVERESGRHWGWLGMLHPALAGDLGFAQNVFLLELGQAFLENRKIPFFHPLSRFPSVRRDLAVVVAETVAAQDLLDAVRISAGDLLTDLTLFDVYRGEGLAKGEKSLALGLILQHPQRTLTEAEVERVINRVLDVLAREFKARLRVSAWH